MASPNVLNSTWRLFTSACLACPLLLGSWHHLFSSLPGSPLLSDLYQWDRGEKMRNEYILHTSRPKLEYYLYIMLRNQNSSKIYLIFLFTFYHKNPNTLSTSPLPGNFLSQSLGSIYGGAVSYMPEIPVLSSAPLQNLPLFSRCESRGNHRQWGFSC